MSVNIVHISEKSKKGSSLFYIYIPTQILGQPCKNIFWGVYPVIGHSPCYCMVMYWSFLPYIGFEKGAVDI